ncbi:MAG: GNAT family N-acetyltransferase [Candidatus Dojkabacteria bacterium]|jgi:predicted acetyltransferase
MSSKETFKLINPSMDYEKEIRSFRQEFITNGGDMDGCSSLRKMENIADWIKEVEDFSSVETCPVGYVPSTQFIYLRENDNKVVGVIKIRHSLNEFLKNYGGHVGYAVCHSERRKGYATDMLREVLPICKKLGLEKILVTCKKGNEGSKKVIKNNNGVYESTVFEPSKQVYLERYWIDLSS